MTIEEIEEIIKEIEDKLFRFADKMSAEEIAEDDREIEFWQSEIDSIQYEARNFRALV